MTYREYPVNEQRKARGPDRTGSIVGVSGAMRARDASRVRPEDEEAAAKRLVIRRRPPDPEQPRTR